MYTPPLRVRPVLSVPFHMSGLLALAVDERFHLKCNVIPDADEDALGFLRQHVGSIDGTPEDIGRVGPRQACRR
jgi:hypothetical protein